MKLGPVDLFFRRGIRLTDNAVLLILLAAFLLPNILFLNFEGLLEEAPSVCLALLGIFLVLLVARRSMGQPRDSESISFAQVSTCFLTAAVLCLLGGQGRIFYANYDWQVRDPLFHDIVVHSWPFKYAVDAGGLFMVLRAPLGIYLFPALLAKHIGESRANLIFLLQNAVILGCVFVLIVSVFEQRRRAFALFSFTFFGGLEIIGYTLTTLMDHLAWHPDHIENWSHFFQYSSVITLVFWTPHHALPGIAAGIVYTLWSKGRAPVSYLLALVPAIGFWSPFALIGVVPFAVHATVVSLRNGEQLRSIFLLPAISGLFCLAPLYYLNCGTSDVHWKIGLLPSGGVLYCSDSPVLLYALFIILQAIPYIGVLVWKGRHALRVSDLWILGFILIVAPFIHVGQGIDFCMRATIPALAIMATALIESLFRLQDNPRDLGDKAVASTLVALLYLGSVTGILEIKRSLTHKPVSAIRCNFVDSWKEFVIHDLSYTTYLADEKAMPRIFQLPGARVVRTGATGTCWDGEWYVP